MEPKGEEDQSRNPSEGGFSGMVVEQYKKMKENAQTYPYVWGSYIFVYGTLGLWITYRWRKLRKTEDRVRALQQRLRKHYETEATSVRKTPPTDESSK